MSDPASTEIVGLEITSRSLVVALVRDGLPVTMARRELADGIIDSGRVRRAKDLTQAIRSLWREEGLPSKKVRVGVPNQLALCRVMQLPDPGSRADLLSAIRLTGRTVFDSLDLATCALGVEELDRDGAVLTISVTAVERAEIDHLLRAVSKAGLQVVAAETNASAEVRALLAPMDPLDTSILVSVGPDATTLSMVERGGVSFLRAVPIGTEDLVSALAGEGRDRVESRRLLSQVGFLTSPPAGIAAEVVADVQNRILGPFDQLMQQLDDSLDFARASRHGSISRMLVMGDGAQIPGLAGAISEYMPVAPLLEAGSVNSFDSVPEFTVYAAALSLSAGHGPDLLENPKPPKREASAGAPEQRADARVSRRGRPRAQSGLGRRARGKERSIPKPYLTAIVATTLGVVALIYGGRQVEAMAQERQQELFTLSPVAATPTPGELSPDTLGRMFATRYDLSEPLGVTADALASIRGLRLARLSLDDSGLVVDVSGPAASGDALLARLEAAGIQVEKGQASPGLTHLVIRPKAGP